MSKQFVMLSAQDCTIDDILYPCWVSIKFDGIRGTVEDGQMVSRAKIPTPNKYIQSKIAARPTILDKLDGELIVGEPDDEHCYDNTNSGVSSVEGEPAFRYYVFDDRTDMALPFDERQKRLRHRFMSTDIPEWCVLVKQQLIESREKLESYYTWLVENGHEGVITRNPLSPYKQGRGTKKAQDMIKLKPREDSDFIVTGFGELERNMNEAFVGERGQTKRSSAKAGKVAGGTLGKIFGRDIHSGVDIILGTFKGLKAKDKQYIWDHQDEFIGKLGIYSYCPVGMSELPRQPSFKGWRSPDDL